MARYSTRTLYGLRLLARLAALPTGQLLGLGEVARVEGIPRGYLEQIARKLKAAGMIAAARGSKGGYKLAQKASEINLENVFTLLEGTLAPSDCGNGGCGHEQTCAARDFWLALDRHMRDFLRGRTLLDIAGATGAIAAHPGDSNK